MRRKKKIFFDFVFPIQKSIGDALFFVVVVCVCLNKKNMLEKNMLEKNVFYFFLNHACTTARAEGKTPPLARAAKRLSIAVSPPQRTPIKKTKKKRTTNQIKIKK
jgi:hypothetical protein